MQTLFRNTKKNENLRGKEAKRWQKSYAELYDELEKVRNMLLIQHNINQKQSTEINLLQEELDRAKNKYGSKLEEMKDKLLDKHKKILILEEQIRSIAYGQQKPIAIQGGKPEDAAPFTDISVHLTHIAVCDDYIAKFSANSPYFLSLEFFDFELQTTPIIQKSATSLDFTTIYNVIVSSLFVHYLKSNGLTIEMYTPRGTSYDLIAAGVISLRPLLQKGGTNKYEGYVKLISIESGLIFANLRYEINIANDLEKSIAMYEKLEAAQKVLPIEIPPDQSEFEELIIMVNRCTGLRNLSKVPMETCIVYEFFSFSPYFTDYVTSSSIAEYNSKREWKLSAKENLHNYLEEAEITFFLFENSPEKKDHDGVLAMLSLPLAPLSANRSLKGSFAMVKRFGTII
uniref:C2-C2_1 domain-containing protein n=1 Tax=Heterorhabditis bacteriophora TaxID=37862 RepID=A0A1I7X924_HETBA